MEARPRKAVTVLLINLAAVVERADEGVLPAVYFFIGRSLNASLSQLGTLTLCRAVVQALSSPLSGLLGDRFDRCYIVAAGCLLWGMMTAAVGMAQTLPQAMVSCAFNGLGLALVIPCVQSLIADYHPADLRGNAFGMMQLTTSLGGMLGMFVATNMGAKKPFGIEGWRFAFYLVAAISLVTAVLVYRFALDPRYPQHHPSVHAGLPSTHLRRSGSGGSGPGRCSGSGDGEPGKAPAAAASPTRRGPPMTPRQVWADIRAVLGIRSFQVLIVQGVVGSVPWQAMAMFTVWLQLRGFSDLEASSLQALFSIGCALGGVLGGNLGDSMARRLPNYGRVLTNQLSVLVGLPLSFLLLKGLPAGGSSSVGLYGAVFFVMGATVSWCGCNNSAIFADLVPEHQRSTIYAFDRSFEGALGACGAPLVGVVAERMFGFSGAVGAQGGAADAANAAALANSLLVMFVVPWTACLLAFTAMHYTYPRDRLAAAKAGGGGVRRDDSEVTLEAQVLIEAVNMRKRGLAA